MTEELINLLIKNREQILYEGKVSSLSSYNPKGKFDVLPQHANFISLVEKEIIYRDRLGKEEKIPVTNGIIKVEQNNIYIYLGIGV